MANLHGSVKKGVGVSYLVEKPSNGSHKEGRPLVQAHTQVHHGVVEQLCLGGVYEVDAWAMFGGGVDGVAVQVSSLLAGAGSHLARLLPLGTGDESGGKGALNLGRGALRLDGWLPLLIGHDGRSLGGGHPKGSSRGYEYQACFVFPSPRVLYVLKTCRATNRRKRGCEAMGRKQE